MEIRELGSNEPELIRQALEIYEEAFPVEERDTPGDLLNAIRQRDTALAGVQGAGSAPEAPVFHFQVALEMEQVAGIAIFSYYPQTRMGFIPYLAVHPGRRNGGLGAQLYQHLVARVSKDGRASAEEPALGIAFEVERPELGKNEAEQDLRRRRIGFYQRNGARLVEPLDLIAPPMGPGLPEMAYAIMFHPLWTGLNWPLERGEIAAVVRTVLEFSYNLAPDSEYIRRAMESIAL